MMRLRILLIALTAWLCGSNAIRAQSLLLTTQTLTLHCRPGFFNEHDRAWETEVNLHGRKMILAFEDTDGKLDSRDWLNLRQPGWKADIITSFLVTRRIFYDGHNYELSIGTIPSKSDVPLTATLCEITSPLGTCEFNGGHVARLELLSPRKYDSVEIRTQTAIFDQPATGALSVPVGTYGAHAYISGKFTVGTVSAGTDDFVINAQKPARLQIGSPLRNTARATRNGDRLELEYDVEDSGGNYCHTVFSTSWPDDWRPGYAVYKGPLKIASGRFGEPLDLDSNLYSFLPPAARVTIPPVLFGNLSIRVTRDLGELGLASSTIDYNWEWDGSPLQIIPWVILLALFGLRSNRRREAWLALVPIVCAHAIFFLVRWADLADDFFLHTAQTWAFAAVFSLCALWLGAPLLIGMRPAKAIAATLLCVAFACCVIFVARLGFGDNHLKLTFMYLPISLCVSTSATAALIVTGMASRIEYASHTFVLGSACIYMILCTLALFVLFSAFTIFLFYPFHEIPITAYHVIIRKEFPDIILRAVANSSFFLILFLPFQMIMLSSRFYLDRLRAVFRF
ncbi:hypothetical protein LLG95_18510 [bacterium]|nr:hypothetical protein [bacterium]